MEGKKIMYVYRAPEWDMEHGKYHELRDYGDANDDDYLGTVVVTFQLPDDIANKIAMIKMRYEAVGEVEQVEEKTGLAISNEQD